MDFRAYFLGAVETIPWIMNPNFISPRNQTVKFEQKNNGL